MQALFIDLETRSRQNIKRVSPQRYVECRDFKILIACWALDDGPIQTATSPESIDLIPGLYDPEVLKVAHNMNFERSCLGAHFELPLPLGQLHDTMAVAAERGYPRSLERCAKALGCTPKDGAGSKLIALFCQPNRNGEFNRPEDYPEEWLDFIAYCEQDVGTLREVHHRLGDFPTNTERLVWEADQRINDRGILVDTKLARAAAKRAEQNLEALQESIPLISSIDNIRSVKQVMAWVAEENLPLKNLQKDNVASLLESGILDATQALVLEARLEAALASSGKFTTALEVVNADDRVRGSFNFFGAHTGRWTGKGLQPQNLPRQSFHDDLETAIAIQDLITNNVGTPNELKAMVRALFVGPFTVVDYSAIEARVLAWMANETWALQAFADGRDIYVETGQRMGGMDRTQGKISVLALGYAGGVNSLLGMAGGALYRNKEGTVQTKPAPGFRRLNDQALWRMVKEWRRANPRIVKLWQVFQDRFERGGSAGPRLRIEADGTTRRTWLPSGRAINYHKVKWEKYFDPNKEKVVESWRYEDSGPYGRIGTYGGRLVENATQAIARDIMAEAIVRLESQGYPVVGHVHDEIIIAGTHDIETISQIMCQQPSWAKGLPLAAAGYTCDRYRKG